MKFFTNDGMQLLTIQLAGILYSLEFSNE